MSIAFASGNSQQILMLTCSGPESLHNPGEVVRQRITYFLDVLSYEKKRNSMVLEAISYEKISYLMVLKVLSYGFGGVIL